MQVSDVFRDSGYPKYTYVERRDGEKEKSLETQLLKRATIVSLSGPSKSGKSVLVDHIVKQTSRIDGDSVVIRGNNINSKEDIWNNALEKLNIPTTRSV